MGTRCVLNHNQVHTVREIQADGKELRWILQNVQCVPKTILTVQSWFGDDAKFIVSNLPYQNTQMHVDSQA